jgi:hypothetical protein
MSVDQIKDGIRELSPSELDQVAALILQLRRSNDPERKSELAKMIDDTDVVPWKAASSG